MSLTSADLPDLSLSPTDEDVQRALAEVNEKLSVFAAAIAQVQAELSEAASRPEPEPPDVESEEKAPEQPAVQAPIEPTAVTPVSVKTQEMVAKVQPQAPEAPAPPRVEPAILKSIPGKPVPARQAAPSQPAKPAAKQVSEDDALLASLDPETAKAIRVMRRLSIEKKSIRQLLDEYNAASTSAGKDEPKKKSWWSRG